MMSFLTCITGFFNFERDPARFGSAVSEEKI
jgi:hypothetical protein